MIQVNVLRNRLARGVRQLILLLLRLESWLAIYQQCRRCGGRLYVLDSGQPRPCPLCKNKGRVE